MEKFMKKDPQALYLSGLISEEQFYYSQSKNESWDAETQKYLDWHKQFTAKFPVGEYNRSSSDRDSLFSGRMISVLDELGEAEKILQYTSAVNSEANYYRLLTRLVKEAHPEMLAQWMDDGYGDRGTR
jgi:hypothetical protein